MIEFLPTRPEMLTATFWHSQAGEKAYQEGYDWYCKNYFQWMATGGRSQHEAEKQALMQGVYLAMINLQAHCQGEERKRDQS